MKAREEIEQEKKDWNKKKTLRVCKGKEENGEERKAAGKEREVKGGKTRRRRENTCICRRVTGINLERECAESYFGEALGCAAATSQMPPTYPPRYTPHTSYTSPLPAIKAQASRVKHGTPRDTVITSSSR
ncbi:hypothetical protein E2C01_065707 [Portunus trituberculatus]|uniref:Uncharacterized protein n=1 Tax=Portunus trituberculatus TaxID=210409 RepID=A0A5B7HGA7_PORTR|nr:hypothetical protein [Portunus trituberculatus]